MSDLGTHAVVAFKRYCFSMVLWGWRNDINYRNPFDNWSEFVDNG